jgi:hypothetical protein
MARCLRCDHAWRMRLRYPKMCPQCKSRLWKTPAARGRPSPRLEAGWARKRQWDFEYDRGLTPTQRFELGLRLNEVAREMRGAYLRAARRAD